MAKIIKKNVEIILYLKFCFIMLLQKHKFPKVRENHLLSPKSKINTFNVFKIHLKFHDLMAHMAIQRREPRREMQKCKMSKSENVK